MVAEVMEEVRVEREEEEHSGEEADSLEENSVKEVVMERKEYAAVGELAVTVGELAVTVEDFVEKEEEAMVEVEKVPNPLPHG